MDSFDCHCTIPEHKRRQEGNSISDFQNALYNLNLTVANYETQTAQDLLVSAVYDYLSTVYTAAGDLEIIEVIAPVSTAETV